MTDWNVHVTVKTHKRINNKYSNRTHEEVLTYTMYMYTEPYFVIRLRVRF